MLKQQTNNIMRVKKRDGTLVSVSLDAITDRIKSMCTDLDPSVIDPVKITIEVVEKIHDGISTSSIDSCVAEICHSRSIEHPHFNTLASRLIVGNHQKDIQVAADLKFSEVCKILYTNTNQLGKHSPLISQELHTMSQVDKNIIDNMVVHERDFLLDYFGFKTLQKGYLLKIDNKVIETPQHMFLRTALGIHGLLKIVKRDVNGNELVDESGNVVSELIQPNYELVKETYDLLSTKFFTHATPTLFNSGTRYPQLFSCFLVGMEDSLESIYDTLSNVAKISKYAGGIGISISKIRSNGAYIAGTGGKGSGIVPMLRVYDASARYVNQGGKRSGSFAIYVEPWHADIEDFLKCKLPHGDVNKRAKDLFYALWVPDLFMERVINNEEWSLMCPSECPGLDDVHGKEFKKLYEKYEKEGRVVKSMNAQTLWNDIIKSQVETGTPYILFKDSANNKSNQKNLGTIKSSNLCAEIIEYADTKKYACCVLASIVLPTFVNKTHIQKDKKKKKGEVVATQTEEKLFFDHEKLAEVVKVVTKNLNKIIDINYYPVKETYVSNISERPIGIGIQGLADVFCKLQLPYDSEESIKLDAEIMETIYYSALSTSMELSKIDGPYATFEGSPISKGKFQFDLWNEFPTSEKFKYEIKHSGRYDWEKLKRDIKKFGVRNSLVTALMPTASTSQIMGSATEAFEPITSNCYTRRVNAGEFIVLNQYMTGELINAGLWNEDMREKLLESRGSIQNIEEIPKKIRDIYKTAWELPQKCLIDHAVARGPYVDQSQSLNLFFSDDVSKVLTKALINAWQRGLKTGVYYTRSKPAANSASFTMTRKRETKEEKTVVFDNQEDTCDSCGS